MLMPFVPDTSTPASKPSELIVIGLVIVTPPKPPGSSTLISPAGAVFEIAPAKVLQGAVRLHGLASSPTPDTQVRVACASATPDTASTSAATPTHLLIIEFRFISLPPQNVAEHTAVPGEPSRVPTESLAAFGLSRRAAGAASVLLRRLLLRSRIGRRRRLRLIERLFIRHRGRRHRRLGVLESHLRHDVRSCRRGRLRRLLRGF